MSGMQRLCFALLKTCSNLARYPFFFFFFGKHNFIRHSFACHIAGHSFIDSRALAAIKYQFEEAKTNAPAIFLSCETLIASGLKRLKSGQRGLQESFLGKTVTPVTEIKLQLGL